MFKFDLNDKHSTFRKLLKIASFLFILTLINSLSSFKEQIGKWHPENCLCRLRKPYIQNIGFINLAWALLVYCLSGSSKNFCILHTLLSQLIDLKVLI